ncbi:glycosyltransferase family 2 protein [Algoriphagus sp. H41]|uniref:Glycosyltransferase family 2 protein n=1 Tax=Algoriphagus oliviformis TaxID=2811231 RepID=A0ABS3C6P8_9BACT|nr:glycosyltransferase family 2 protein [Algoriphagus oliviformis]MBN7812795.1 glycosyltransferase family 2 protein [Algoriphagus oliviformis]
MKALPLLSIGLCTYNGGKYLRQQLESLVSQTYRPLEIRIRDDQSTDDTFDIIREFQAAHPFIHAIQNEERLGLQKNFEAVFQDCTGELIAPCDQDDIWAPNKLENLQKSMGSHVMVYHDSELIDEAGGPMGYRISDRFRLGNFTLQTPFLLFNCVSGHGMLFQRKILELAIPIPPVGFYDHWLALVALEFGTIGYSPDVLVKYRQHSDNQTDILGNKKKLTGMDRVRSRISRENTWLEVCSKFLETRNPSHPAIQLNQLAKKRESSYFTFGLGWEIWQRRREILDIVPYSTFAKLAFSFRYSLGLKTKQLFYAIR